MKKMMTVLSALLFVCFPLSAALGDDIDIAALLSDSPTETSVAQRGQQPEVPFVPRQPAPENPTATTPQLPGRATQVLQPGTRAVPEAQAQVDLRNALQELNRLTQRARSTGNPLAQEWQNAVQNLQGAINTTLAARPATPPAPAARNPLNAEKEKIYIELARQYFYVFTGTPEEVVRVVQLGRPLPIDVRTLVQAEESTPIQEVNEDAQAMPVASPLVADDAVAEEKKSEREQVLENFMDCIKKISPAAQLSLIRELVQISHTNEELKLLEGLLDEVLDPPATNSRTPAVRQPTSSAPQSQPRSFNPQPTNGARSPVSLP